MKDFLKSWIAQAESWQSAMEYNINREEWAQYRVRGQIDDFYIYCLAAAFDAFRLQDEAEKASQLLELAKSLYIFSDKVCSDEIRGIDLNRNLLYSSSLFYLAEFSATAVFVARKIDRNLELQNEAEEFLLYLTTRKLSPDTTNVYCLRLKAFLAAGNYEILHDLKAALEIDVTSGLVNDPNLFFAAKLSLEIMIQFSERNIWHVLEANTDPFEKETWTHFISSCVNAKSPIWDLFPSQITALNSGLLSADSTVSMQMPTSAGKTALCETLIYYETKVLERKVLFLVPFRALAAEIKEGLAGRLSKLDIQVVASYGGNIPSNNERVRVDQADVLIVTPEKYQALDQMLENFSDRFSTVICDEGHLIDDDSRGLSYELLLTKLRSENSTIQRFVFLSAILPNVSDIHNWLGGEPDNLAGSNYKPVEQEFILMQRQGNGYRLNANPGYTAPRNYFLKHFISKSDLQFRNPITGNLNVFEGNWANPSMATLAARAALKVRESGAVAVFTTTKGKSGVAGVARRILGMFDKLSLFEDGDLSDEHIVLIEYIEYLLGKEHLLAELLPYKAGLHHGDLPQEIRRAVEAAIHDGLIDLIVCTSTLAEGVNLPVRTMIVHTTSRFNGEITAHIKHRTIKNVIGRAGRAGKETKGRIIFINPSDHSMALALEKDQNLEAAKGALFRLVESIEKARIKFKITAFSNELFEAQESWFIEILETIDYALLDLMPENIAELPGDYLNDLLRQTLAYRQCETEELKACLINIFDLRKQFIEEKLQTTELAVFKRSGTTPRFYDFVCRENLIEHKLWSNLADVLDPQWFDEIVMPIFEYQLFESELEQDDCRKLIEVWMSGGAYIECSERIDKSVEDTLKALQKTIWFQLQVYMSQLSSLAKESHEDVSDLARLWPSLVQYGIATLQQLELMESGLSDRFAVWGISRWLDKNSCHERGRELRNLVVEHQDAILADLREDDRVPEYSIRITENELLGLWAA